MQILEKFKNGLVLMAPDIYKDSRGYFTEFYNKSWFDNEIGEYNFCQDNQSFSTYGTVRGLHFQKGDSAQAKLVSCMRGVVCDTVVDIRKDSSTFGKVYQFILSEDNKHQLLVPRGFAHGFSVLSKNALFTYKCDNKYDKSSEGGINLLDKDLNINWHVYPFEMVISDKDKLWPSFNDFLKAL